MAGLIAVPAADRLYLTVPKLKQLAISDKLLKLTEFVGGCTETDVRGAWKDSSGAWWVEEAIKYEWAVFGFNPTLNMADKLHIECIEALLDSGEQAVMAGNKLYTRRTA